MPLELRNPHSVLAALRTRPGAVQAVRLATSRPSGTWKTVADHAARAGIPVEVAAASASSPPGQRSRQGSGESKQERSGVSHAVVLPREPVGLDALFRNSADATPPGRWLALDSVQDPRNVGAIIRSAGFFGVSGVLMTQDRSAPLTAVTYDTASGGMEAVPFSQETNLSRALRRAKEAGLWIVGSSERAATAVTEIPLDRPWLLVVGNEERGLRRLTLDNCDEICRIAPLDRGGTASDGLAKGAGGPSSLNVSVATAIMLAMLSRPA